MKHLHRFSFAASAAALACALAFPAHAQSFDGALAAVTKGLTVKAGIGHISPHSTSTDITGTQPVGGGSSASFPVPAGNHLTVQPKSTFVLSFERAINDNVSIELVLGTPPIHDVKLSVGHETRDAASKVEMLQGIVAATGGMASPFFESLVGAQVARNVVSHHGDTISKARQMAPTMFVNYKFGTPSSTLRPFIGLGVNLTTFKATSTPAGVAALNDGPLSIKLGNSVGAAAQAGVTYRIDEHWSLNAAWTIVQVKSEMVATTAHSVQRATFRSTPTAFLATVGYSF